MGVDDDDEDGNEDEWGLEANPNIAGRKKTRKGT